MLRARTVENEHGDHTLFISCRIHNDIFQNLQNTLTEEGCILHIRLHERIRYHVETAGDGGWNGLVLCDRDQYIVVIQLEGEEKREKTYSRENSHSFETNGKDFIDSTFSHRLKAIDREEVQVVFSNLKKNI